MRQSIKIPLSALVVLLSIVAFWRIFDLPSQVELIELTREYFEKYGLLMVFVSAVIEGMILAGWYYPGSSVIFLGVIFADGDLAKVVSVVAAVTAGLFIAYVFNFFLGKYGWYKLLTRFGLREPLEKAEKKVEKHGASAVFLTFWHPNLAALTSAAAGILRVPAKKFLIYALLATIAWNIFWGALVNFLGQKALGLIGVRFVLMFVGLWIIGNLILKKSDKASPGHIP